MESESHHHRSRVLAIEETDTLTDTYALNTLHRASIGGGQRLGDIAVGLNKKGWALSHGTCPFVGVGGHAGQGGFGLAARQWGLMLDSITG